jgi:ParB family chromosome partitioning protein
LKEAKAKLKTLDEIFGGLGVPGEGGENAGQRIPIDLIDRNPLNPYGVRDTPDMLDLINSVNQLGVLEPILVRPKNGRYELLSGERRLTASERCGLSDIPVVVKEDIDEDTAALIIVDTNIKREDILPSERAKAYKLKYTALKHQGKRGEEKPSLEFLAEESGLGVSSVQHYLRLAELCPSLLACVDKGADGAEAKGQDGFPPLKIKPAVHLSYLAEEEQEAVYAAICKDDVYLSLKQAEQLREKSSAGELDASAIDGIIKPQIFDDIPKITLKGESLKQWFPGELRGKELEEEIFRFIESKQSMEKQFKKMFPELSSDKLDAKIIEIVNDWHRRRLQKQQERQEAQR